MLLPIKFPPFHINSILPNSAPQILHGQNRTTLAGSSTSTSIARPLHPKDVRTALPLVLSLLWLLRLLWCSWKTRRSSGHCCGCRGSSPRIWRAHTGVLVGVSSYVRNEFLSGESEKAGELYWSWGGRKASKRQVVLRYRIGDLVASVSTKEWYRDLRVDKGLHGGYTIGA